MDFRINNRNWEIKELSQEEMRETYKNYKYDGEPAEGKYFGLTYFDKQIILIDKDLHIEQKQQTLMHELMHCYLGTYGFTNSHDQYNEEDVCNISANSHDVIHAIIEKYFHK